MKPDSQKLDVAYPLDIDLIVVAMRRRVPRIVRLLPPFIQHKSQLVNEIFSRKCED